MEKTNARPSITIIIIPTAILKGVLEFALLLGMISVAWVIFESVSENLGWDLESLDIRHFASYSYKEFSFTSRTIAYALPVYKVKCKMRK